MSLTLLRRAREAGLVLYVEQGRLKFRAQASGPPQALRDEITRNKAALIAYLQAHGSGAQDGPRAAPDQTSGPLSRTQARVYYHETAFDTGASYVMAAAYRFDGTLDPQRLEAAIARILHRHGVLRSRFFADQHGTPVQQPLPFEALDFRLDVSTDMALPAWLSARDTGRIDPAKGHVIDVALLQSDGASHLYVACHHLVFDGWSYGCFFAELSALYEDGETTTLPDLPFQYVDFARWQSTKPWSEHSRAYWRSTLAGVAPLNALTPDFARQANMSFAGQTHQTVIDAAQVGALRALAQHHNVSLYSAALAVFALVVARYTDTAQCVIGTPLAGRTVAQTDRLIGLFSNVIPLRLELDQDAGFDALLRHVQQVNGDGQAHQDLHFEQIIQDLGFAGQSGFTPLCQIVFSFDEGARGFSLGGFAATQIPVARGSVNFEFELHLIAQPDGSIDAVWAYAENLFSAQTVAAMAQAFDVALTRVVAAPAAPLKTHSLLGEGQSDAWQRTTDMTLAVPQDKGFADLFEDQAALRPDACACLWRDEAGQIVRHSYADLNAWSNRIAHALMQAGASANDCIAVTVDHGSRNVAALLAVQKIGASHVVLDLSNPVTRNQHILAMTNCRFMIGDPGACAAFDGVHVTKWNTTAASGATTTSGATTAATASCAATGAATVANGAAASGAATACGATTNPDRRAMGWTPQAAALTIFTSGSTGTPKGIVIENRALTHFLFAARARLDVTGAQCFSVAATLTFDAHMLEIFLPLAFGASLALFDPTRFRDGALLNTEQEAMGVDVIFATPTTWQVLLDEGWHPRDGQTLLIGGEMLPVELRNRLLAQIGTTRLINVYGPSECTTFVLCAPMERDGPVHVGWPVAHTQIEIVDGHGNLCPALCIGELVIGGAQVARGYVAPDGAAAARFGTGMNADPAMAHYKTGDLARRWPDGRFEIIGRRDFQVKHNGVRIELGEIEAALLTHPAVQQAVAVSTPMPGGGAALTAYVQGALDVPEAAEALRAHLEHHLPRAYIPASFVVLDAMPLTPSGKIDRNALPAPATQSVPQTEHPAQTALEAQLCAIWSEITGARVEDTQANFFAIGGHSLLAIKMLNRVNHAFATALVLRDVIGDLTVGALAAHIQAQTTTPGRQVPQIVAAPSEGPAPLSFAQERMWAIDRIDAHGLYYTIPVIFDIDGPFDGDALAQFLDTMLARHAVLRSTYHADDSGLWQTPQPPAPGLLRRIDATVHRDNAAGMADALRKIERDSIDAPFDLATGPLVRSTLVKLGPARHRWFLALHHIAFDGRSLEVFLDALSDFLQTGDCPPAPAIAYADYARWQAAQYDVATDLRYWQDRLAGIPDCHAIPLDRARGDRPGFGGGTLCSALGVADTARLRAFARAHGATEFSVLFAALAAYLCAISDSADIVIGTPVANRNDAALDHVIGNFVNSVALRSTPDLNAGFADLVQTTQRDLQMDMAHQELPFEKLVQALDPVRTATHSPIFQVMILTDNSDSAERSIGQTVLRTVQPAQTEAKFDLTLGVRSGDTIELSWTFATDIFDRDTIQRHANQFARFVDQALAAPQRPLQGHLPQTPLTLVHGPQAEIDMRRFAERFQTAADLHAQQPALVWGDQVLSYSDLWHRADRLAARLRKAGVGPGTLVGLHLARSFDMITALVAVHLTGAAHLPLDPSYPAARLAQIAAGAKPILILSSAPQTDFQAPSLRQAPDLRQAPNLWQAPLLCPATDRFTPAAPAYQAAHHDSDTAYVIYTSGSTGQPKGVAVQHRSLCNYLDWITRDRGLGAHDTVLQITSLSFDIAITEVLAPLSVGATVVLAQQDDAMDGAGLGDLINKHEISVLQLVPTVLHILAGTARSFPAVRTLLCGGETVPVRLMQTAHTAFPNASLASVYGPTEATVWTSVHDFTGTEAGALMPLGTPLPNTCLAFRATQGGTPTELLIGGEGLAAGYLGDPARTAAAFVQAGDPGQRLYRSGDLVAQSADGALNFLGRNDTQIKLRGHRIELAEIEAALIDSGAARAVCVLRDGQIAAFVDHSDPAALREMLCVTLPDHMIPSAFVQIADFPLTPNNKIDRTALATLPIAPAAPARFEAPFEPPQGEIEETLAEIWHQVLERDQIGRHDNFFTIGGHSLRAIRVVTILRDMLEQDIPVRVLFENVTIATLGAFIENLLADEPGAAQ